MYIYVYSSLRCGSKVSRKLSDPFPLFLLAPCVIYIYVYEGCSRKNCIRELQLAKNYAFRIWREELYPHLLSSYTYLEEEKKERKITLEPMNGIEKSRGKQTPLGTPQSRAERALETHFSRRGVYKGSLIPNKRALSLEFSIPAFSSAISILYHCCCRRCTKGRVCKMLRVQKLEISSQELLRVFVCSRARRKSAG